MTSASGARQAGAGGEVPSSRSPGLARPLIVSGTLAACSAAGVGLGVLTILVLAGWIAAPHPGLGLPGVLRTAAVLWLVGHHVGVDVSGAGRIGMLPLGLVLLPGALLWRAGRWLVGRHGITGMRQALAAAATITAPYTALAVALALGSRSALAAPSVPQALVAGFAVAAVSSGLGATRALAPLARLGAVTSPTVRSVLTGAAGSLATLAAAGALLTALALAGHLHEFGAVNGLLGPGLIGAGLLFLAELAYLPNAVIWAAAYLLGPGFAVGAGTIVAPTGSSLGPLPAFPLLAVLPPGPHSAEPAVLTVVALSAPYLAGLVGGLLAARSAPTVVLEAAPARGFGCGALSGVVLGLLAAFAGGPLGDGRLAAVGPSGWQVAVVGSLEIGIAAAIAAGAANWRRMTVHAKAAAARRSAADSPPWPPDGEQAAAWHTDPAADPGQRNVIYLDRWAGESAPDQPPRPTGPSVLP
jgi:Family of unknown function (DUF6350)